MSQIGFSSIYDLVLGAKKKKKWQIGCKMAQKVSALRLCLFI